MACIKGAVTTLGKREHLENLEHAQRAAYRATGTYPIIAITSINIPVLTDQYPYYVI
jgi:hypothetical protein